MFGGMKFRVVSLFKMAHNYQIHATTNNQKNNFQNGKNHF